MTDKSSLNGWVHDVEGKITIVSSAVTPIHLAKKRKRHHDIPTIRTEVIASIKKQT